MDDKQEIKNKKGCTFLLPIHEKEKQRILQY